MIYTNEDELNMKKFFQRRLPNEFIERKKDESIISLSIDELKSLKQFETFKLIPLP